MSDASDATLAGFKLSPQQERLWIQQTGNPEPFSAQCEVLLEGPLNEAALRSALREAVARHESLRTVFERQSGFTIPFQVIQPVEADAAKLYFNLETLGPDRHALSISLPALCADRRSLENLVKEIGQAYSGTQENAEAMQYLDVVEWQRELLAGEDSKPGRDFWRVHFQKLDLASSNSVLVSFETGDGKVFSPAAAVRTVEGAARSRIATYCTGRGITEADFVLACWQIFLWRMTDRSGIATACEFDGRKYAELDDAIGLFSKYLPLQFDIEPEMRFDAFADQVKDNVAEAAKWQDAFAWANVELPANSDAGPLFSTAFDYAPLMGTRAFGGTSFHVAKLDSCTEQFELKLSARGGPDALELAFRYDASHLASETVEQWSGYFIALMTAAAETPATPVGRLPLLDESTRRKLLTEWNQTAAAFPNACLHELFQTQATLTPDRAALRFEERELTYRELNEKSNRLAHALIRGGLPHGALVGLCLERGAEMIVALLAIFKAGGAYVPLLADQPKPRLAQQLAGVAALVTEEKFLDRLPGFTGETICLDRDSWREQPATDPALNSHPADLAYVIYTSGSTGTPKGVAVRHSNLVNYAWFIKGLLKLDSEAEGLQFATVSTLAADLGNTCIYPSLISGGCLHVIAHDTATDSGRLRDYAAKHPYDVLKIVPSHLAALLDSDGGGEVLPRKYLLLGGEAFSRQLLGKISALHPACEILNHYGPTETTVGSLTLALKTYHPEKLVPTLPIGGPIANTSVYVLDARQQPVPPGVAGELYIAGAGVTAGYLNQPELTDERFLPDPFVGTADRKMYRTGDVVRYLPEGQVEFLGRADDQVKIRGYRVELGEVETILSAHEGVKQAVVVAGLDERGERGEKRLIAYVTAHREQTLKLDELRAWLKEQLPDHMVPAAMMVLPRLPLTANGKVDRRNLPEPPEEQAHGKEYAAPQSPTEALIAGLWGEILRRDAVGLDDNFFDIGGHSLLATQVVSRMRRSLEIDIQLRAMFDAPTVRQMAAIVDRARREGDSPLPPPLVRVPRDRPLPLSFVQQRLWVIDRLQPGNPVYNIPRILRMKGSLNLDALQKALHEIVRRHESQRTVFPASGGEPVQVITDTLPAPVTLEDLSGLPEEEREAEARRLAGEEARRPFDLINGPLARHRLLRLAPDDHIFLLTVHHIISDGWSAGIFFQELSALYEAFTRGKPSPLPALAIQCADYAVWQRQWLRGEVLTKLVAWWREHLKGAPPVLELPADRPRSEKLSYQGASEIVPFSPELASTLNAFSRKEDVTLFITLLAGFQALLSRLTNQEQIVVGTDVANRTAVEVEPLIGCFINVLALHTDLSGNPTFRELLGRVRKVALGAWAHQDIPFDKLVEELQPERSSSRNPIVQVLFVMQNIPAPKREMAGLELVSFPMPVKYSKFDLAVFMTEREGKLSGYWVYSSDLFDRATILRFAGQFERLLTNAAAAPDTRISDLEMFSEEEKERLIAEKKMRKGLQRQGLMSVQPKPVREL